MSDAEKGFTPTDHLMNLKGKSYLPVAARVVWFREQFPAESGWAINTLLVDGGYEKKFAVYRCEITDPHGRVVAVGHNVEEVKGFGDFMQKAETGSIGRALATLGFGTMAALEEGQDNVVDSPVDRRPQRPADPEPMGYECEVCGAEVDHQIAGASRRKFNGRVLCVKDGRVLLEGVKAQGALCCADCGQIVTEKVASASLQGKGRHQCVDCAKAEKGQVKEAVAV
jgi:hypothetical protein